MREKNKILIPAFVFIPIFLIALLTINNYPAISTTDQNNLAIPQSDQKNIAVKINNNTFNLKIADTEQERSRGLMDVKSMEENEGMLFVFEESAMRNFWMKNTYIPLDIIFIDSNKKIIEIHKNTKPLDTSPTYSSVAPAQYAIELNGGVAAKLGINEGDRVIFE